MLLEPGGTQGRDRMKTTRTTFPLVVGFAAVWMLLPASAAANPLLSGYGGPGEGNQVILGSQLLTPPPGNGGGGGAGSLASGEPPSAPASAGATASGAVPSPGRPAAAGHGRTNVNPGGPLRALTPIYPSPAGENLAAKSHTLGLSGEDLALLILAVCGLLAIALASARLAAGAATLTPASSSLGPNRTTQ